MARSIPPLSSPAPRGDFISAMRRVAASVTVVTTDGPAGCLGATVSAFSSVSADPPTVLVCLHAESRVARAVTENGAFCVNVLPEGSNQIADRFAGREDHLRDNRFDGIASWHAKGCPPRLPGATVFDCHVDQVLPAGSHLVVLGRVHEVHDGQTAPLAYLDGAYHRVAPHFLGNAG